MGVSVTTTATDITVSVNDQSISASVGGGIGPQGPASTAAAGVSSLNALTGALTVSAGANVTVTTNSAGLTISAPSGGASSWGDITGKPSLVYSVAGRTGTVTLTTSDIGGYVAPAVSSVAGRTGAVTLTAADIGDFATVAAAYGPVTSVAGRTGAVALASTDLSDFATAAAKYGPVTSVSGRTGDVTISTTDVSGYTAPQVSSVAGRTGAVTLTTSDIGGNLVATVNGISGTPSIVAGANVTVTTAASSITIASAAGAGYTLPAATTSTLGGVIVGGGLAVDGSGNLSVNERLATSTSVATTSASTSETTLGSVSITAVANDVFRVRMWGDATNNSGSTTQFSWRVKLGSTTLGLLQYNFPTSTSTARWVLEAEIVCGSSSTQASVAWFLWQASTTAANTIGDNKSGTGTEDTTSAKTLSVTLQMSNSTGTPSAPSYTVRGYTIERRRG